MKTTPTLGPKLYDGTDAPDLVSGYNASMSALDAKRLFRYLGQLSDLGIDLNNCRETGYWNSYNYVFTAQNHGPVGSFSRGILVVYDKCAKAGQCHGLRQEYYPEPYGTGDAYRPMVRTLNSDNAKWTEWRPLVEVPEVPDNVVAYNGNTNCLLANGTEVAALKMRSIEGLELLNGVQLAPATITSEEEMTEFLVGATKYGAWVGSGTVSHGKVYGGGPAPCACNAFRQDNVDALNLVITGIAPANLEISTFQIVAMGDGKSQSFTLRGIILTYDEGGGAPTQTLINKFSDLSDINLKLSRMANS